MMWETSVYYLLSSHLLPREEFELWEGLRVRYWNISFRSMAICTALIILIVFDCGPTRGVACRIFSTWLWHFCRWENNLLCLFTLLLLQLVLLALMLDLYYSSIGLLAHRNISGLNFLGLYFFEEGRLWLIKIIIT